ncbi:hypothetical protein L7F22_031220 [Adiantum nelumboides]|nr:hypothetical protein [Adiantum nelumboides]
MLSSASRAIPELGQSRYRPRPAPCARKRCYPCANPHVSVLPQHSLPSPKRPVAASSSSAGADLPHHDAPNSSSQQPPPTKRSIWTLWQGNAAEMRAQVAKLGLAAVLAYGLFDGITYTTFFVLAFLGYEKSTGTNPAANIQALLGIVILMWTGNNVTRPLRVAGAAALAPVVDKALQKIQKTLNLPNQDLPHPYLY